MDTQYSHKLIYLGLKTKNKIGCARAKTKTKTIHLRSRARAASLYLAFAHLVNVEKKNSNRKLISQEDKISCQSTS